MGNIGPGTGSIVSAIAMAGGAYTQSQALDAQGKHQESVARMNAELASEQARQAESRGEQAAKQQELKSKLLRGKQRAVLAASGVDIDSGSALEIQEESAALGALDAMMIRNNAIREAYGYKSQSLQYGAQGAWQRSAAQAQATQTLLTGGLQTLGTGLDAYYKINKTPEDKKPTGSK